MKQPVTYEDILEARGNIVGVTRRTPLEISNTFSNIVGSQVYFKYENLQKTGSFKIRGACNKIAFLTESERKNGVIAASAGNHAQGVAYGAHQAGIKSTIVMPAGVPIAKLMATKSYGAQVVLSGESYDDAFVEAQNLQRESGAVFINAFNDPAIIAGQGTVGYEIFEDLPELDTILVPIGGGGLISGIAIALKSSKPSIRIVGVQAQGASSMKDAVESGVIRELASVSTIADGIAIKRPGTLTFPLIQKYVDDIVLVDDEEIAEAILMMLERAKVMCEGAAAVGIAALLHERVTSPGKTVVVISGGNIDVHTLNIIIERGLIKAGRYVRMKTVVGDKPGALQKLLGVVAATKANVVSVIHERILPRVPITKTEIQLELETRDRDHVDQIVEALTANGYIINIEEY